MPNYRRNFVPDGCYFFTVNLLERKRNLLIEHIDLLRDSVRTVRRLYPFHIDAWVVLPGHMHCVLTLPPDDDDYPLRWRLIKLLFSKGLPATERLSSVRKRRGERGIWQRRYWEHTIRDESDYSRHIDYIHLNPKKHGYVKQVVDWPYSTFHRYVTDGLLPVDWCGSDGNLTTAGNDDLRWRYADAKSRYSAVWTVSVGWICLGNPPSDGAIMPKYPPKFMGGLLTRNHPTISTII